MSIRFDRAFARVLLFMSIATFTAGCGRPAPAVSNVEAAIELLKTSFESWKSGGTVASLREATPPVYVAEEMWDNGFRLTSFSIDDDGELYGTNVRLLVTLTGTDKGGLAVSRQLKYLVTTTPALTIARADR